MESSSFGSDPVLCLRFRFLFIAHIIAVVAVPVGFTIVASLLFFLLLRILVCVLCFWLLCLRFGVIVFGVPIYCCCACLVYFRGCFPYMLVYYCCRVSFVVLDCVFVDLLHVYEVNLVHVVSSSRRSRTVIRSSDSSSNAAAAAEATAAAKAGTAAAAEARAAAKAAVAAAAAASPQLHL